MFKHEGLYLIITKSILHWLPFAKMTIFSLNAAKRDVQLNLPLVIKNTHHSGDICCLYRR